MWAAYHNSFLEGKSTLICWKLLDSSIAEMQESGAYLESFEMENLIFPLLRIFYQSEGDQTSGRWCFGTTAISQDRNSFSAVVRDAITFRGSLFTGIESTANNLLVLDINVYWFDLETRLAHFSHPPVTIALFSALVSAVDSVNSWLNWCNIMHACANSLRILILSSSFDFFESQRSSTFTNKMGRMFQWKWFIKSAFVS